MLANFLDREGGTKRMPWAKRCWIHSQQKTIRRIRFLNLNELLHLKLLLSTYNKITEEKDSPGISIWALTENSQQVFADLLEAEGLASKAEKVEGGMVVGSDDFTFSRNQSKVYLSASKMEKNRWHLFLALVKWPIQNCINPKIILSLEIFLVVLGRSRPPITGKCQRDLPHVYVGESFIFRVIIVWWSWSWWSWVLCMAKDSIWI